LISDHYSKTVAYNLHKAVAEFAAHCDMNRLCHVFLSYKYSKMVRPSNVNGIGFKRLDDPSVVTDTKNERMVDIGVFKILGELHRNVPKDHKYRFYILVLTFFICTGRRFTEILSMPHQDLQKDEDGLAYLDYFPRKTSKGNSYTPKVRLYLPTQAVAILKEVITEVNESCTSARDTAKYTFDTGDVDLRFLNGVSDTRWLYREQLQKIGVSPTLVDITGWIRKNGYAFLDKNFITLQGHKKAKPYTTKEGIEAYCRKDFIDTSHNHIHLDQEKNEYFLKDLMFVKYQGLSSGYYAKWLASECTHSMMTTFQRYLPDLTEEFASKRIDVDFTTHDFRHTINTLLDEGGLTDVMQTEWFGRKNPNDTKAYQHTTREKRILMIREDILKGTAKGVLAEEIKALPITHQNAVLNARIHAVQDVGTGVCIHNFSQMPCERQLSCAADCKDYLWIEDDKGRVDELKRKYAFTVLARETALEKTTNSKPKNSADWIAHNDIEISTLTKQFNDNSINIETFNPKEYMDDFLKKEELNTERKSNNG